MPGPPTLTLAAPFMPEQASTYAGAVDWLWNFCLLITAFFTVLIMGLLIYFLIKNSQRSKADRATYSRGATHSTPLEVSWIIVPTIIVIALFVFGFKAFLDMSTPPSNAYEILVIAKQWNWTFKYPDGTVTSELHVPADTPIRLQLQSNDVLHSLYVPAFRAKKDVVPGRYNKMWFESPWDEDDARPLSEVLASPPAGMAGSPANVYDIYCAEYCGTGHSTMRSRVVVHKTKKAFIEWKEAQGIPGGEVKPADFGKQVFTQFCAACHQAEGKGASIGPPWDNLFASTAHFEDSPSETVDENYVRESMLYPQRKIVEGYTDQNMSTFKGLLNEYQITGIIEYMKSISDNYEGSALESFQTPSDTGPEPKGGGGDGASGGNTGGNATGGSGEPGPGSPPATAPGSQARRLGRTGYRFVSAAPVSQQGALAASLAARPGAEQASPVVHAGRRAARIFGCINCHSTDGTTEIAPTWRNLYGRLDVMADGELVEVDAQYIRQSVMEPLARVAADYPPIMPSFNRQVGERDLTAIIEYMKSLSHNHIDPILQTWEPNYEKMSQAEAGAHLYRSKGCYQCHSLDGSQMVGPTWRGMFGKKRNIRGRTFTIDDDYIRQSILKPQALRVPEFAVNMPDFSNAITDREINALIAYMKTLSDRGDSHDRGGHGGGDSGSQ